LRQQAFTASQSGQFLEAEDYWTELIGYLPQEAALWSNRGNVRVSQNRLEEAIADYNQAIDLAPDQPDPYLNRGTALEGLGQWQAAIADYTTVLRLNPEDAAEYQLDHRQSAIRQFRNLTRRYPNFADARAALTAALWLEGQPGEAESNWVAVAGLDPRYKDLDWVSQVRRWPPAMVGALEKFLTLSN
jgi:tetratricopeptide (TPR) repeat protein